MTNPRYFECPRCGFYHVSGAGNSCGNDNESFITEELNENHPDGWDEEYADEDVAPTPVARPHRNYDRMMALTANADINGRKLEAGTRIRCYSLPHHDPENDWFVGMDGSYVEGRIVEILDYTAPYTATAPYYLIDMEREVAPVVDRTRNDFATRPETQPRMAHGQMRVPVNGTLVKGIRITDKGSVTMDPDAPDWRLFGVVAV